MTKRNYWKKSLLILGVGMVPHALFFAPDGSCVSNTDVETFYQAVGNASVNTLSDASAAVFGADGDAIIIQPATNFINGMWNNWIDERVPDDPTFGSPWRT